MALGGSKPITETVAFPDFSIRTLPYEKIPGWALGQPWEAALLTVGESGGYINSEGMWEWSAGQGYVNGQTINSGLQSRYLAGYADAPPLEAYQDIRPGFRGEYAVDFARQPWLYFSPVDRRLHLGAAQEGVWNLGDERRIRYQNLDGDDYIDQWEYYAGDGLIQQLNQAAGSLIASGFGKVAIQRAEAPNSLFQTAPPRSHAEWLTLDQQLQANRLEIAPDDFLSWLEQFEGESLRIDGASLSDYRTLPEGFRFELELQPGYTVEGSDWLGLAGKAPGDYIVTYDGAYQVAPASPPEIQFAAPLQVSPAEPITAYAPRHVQVTLANQGLQDAAQVRVSLGMTRSRAGARLDRAADRHRACRRNHARAFHLGARFPGEWKMLAQARLLDHESAPIKSVAVEQVVEVLPAEQTNIQPGAERLWPGAALAVGRAGACAAPGRRP